MRGGILMLGVALVCAGCAQQLGGTHGDPTVRPKTGTAIRSPASVSDRAAPVALMRQPQAPRAAPQSPAVAPGTPAPANDAGVHKSRIVPPGRGLPAATMKPAAAAPLAGSSLKVAGKDRAPRVITVGVSGEVATIAQVAKLARDGDTVEVQAGEYRGDVAVWTQKQLTLRAVGGRAVLVADGRAAEGKGIWVIRGGEFIIEGFDFVGARVGQRNGAGIRFERGSLVVRDARFIDNENGILTSNDRELTLVVERSLFSGNGYGDGQSHGLYAGAIARLEVRGSYFRNGKIGHLLKTRARENRIEYNRLTDEAGNSSYELEFPVGGGAVVVGNIIEQSPDSSNSTIISWGAEGFRWPVNELTLSHNTVVNLRPQGGVFLRVRAGQPTRVVLLGNVWAGDGTFAMEPAARREGDIEIGLAALPGLKNHDYGLSAATRARFAMKATGADGMRPTKQYVHERGMRPLTMPVLVPGAVQ